MEIDSILSNLPEKVSDPSKNMPMQMENCLNFNDSLEKENLINTFSETNNSDSDKKYEVVDKLEDISKNISVEPLNSNEQLNSMNILDCITNYTDILSDKIDENEEATTDEHFNLIAQSLVLAQDTNNSNDYDQLNSLVSSETVNAEESVSTMDDSDTGELITDRKSKRKFVDENDHQSTENKKKHSAEEKKCINIRKNIREIMEENQLDATTLAAQRQESERLARVQEQQKVVREIQRQIVINRQTTRAQQFMASRNIPSSLLKSKSITITPTARTLSQHAEKFAAKDLSNGGLTDTYIVKGLAEEVTFQDNKYPGIDKSQITVIPKVIKKPTTDVPSIQKRVVDEPKEVVTITDSSSDDDCIVLSDDEEIKEEPEDDPHNSGLHVNDLYNIPDENGRVVVNIGHTADESDIYVAPQIERIIKPHQIGGIRFLFDNIIESVERFNQSSGFGCILAHSMGLGKTLQVICFCDIFFRHTNSKTVLCIMPINTLQNWVSEFDKWLPANVDESQASEIRARNFKVYVLNDQSKSLTARARVILQWSKEGGVLLMGYELFRLLSLKLVNVKKKSKAVIVKKKESEAHKRLIVEIHEALVKPGPDLVICDEGHRIKNSHAGISVALKQIRTKRRIVLTGYPLQNNLLEYWCMVDFVRPNYLGTRTEFCNMFERPIQNGQCIDSTPNDIKFMRFRAHVLHSLLVGFVQRRSHMVLQNTLPQKQEYVILVRMTTFQRKLYEILMNDVVRTKTVPNPLKAFAVCCKIWNHPDVLYNFLKTREPDFDLEVEEVNPPQTPVLSSSLSNTQQIPKTSEDNGYCSNENSTQLMSSIPYEIKTENASNSNNTDILSHENQFATAGQNYWSESSNYFGYDCSTTNSVTQKPDFVGTIVKPINSLVKSNDVSTTKAISSEIVDLDTKEIKTVPTDMNLDVNQIKKESSVEVKSMKTNEIVNKPDIPKGKDDGIPYDWAIDLMKGHTPDLIETSPKMEIFFCLLEECLKVGDRILLFSQSLLTLNLIERFLQRNKVPGKEFNWSKNSSYFRIDGSTSAMERERLINEFNANENIHLFLVSTKAGSLGINLVGANRVIVFDASWNPCHDIQAVCRVYRYGQQKPCFIYRMVMDNCLEKKIYDRQINKQGMADRVVDECNPDAHLSLKEVTNLCYDYDQETEVRDFSDSRDKYPDNSIKTLLEKHSKLLSKEPFFHESLLVDRKEKKLSSAEKRMAQRSYEIAKKAAAKPIYQINTNTMQYRTPIVTNSNGIPRPIANVRPNSLEYQPSRIGSRSTRWIPAEVWQRQGMTAQEMILPLDVVIPTSSGEKSNILLKAGQKVMVLKSTKGVYMQLESGKIIAIRTSTKLNPKKESGGIEVTTIGNKMQHRFRQNIVNTNSSMRRGIMLNERHGRTMNQTNVSNIDSKIANKEFNPNHSKHKNSSNTAESDSDDVIVLNDNCDPLPAAVKSKRSPVSEGNKNELASNHNSNNIEQTTKAIGIHENNSTSNNVESRDRHSATLTVPKVQQNVVKTECKNDDFMNLPALTPLTVPNVKNVEAHQHVETKQLDAARPNESEKINDNVTDPSQSLLSQKRFMPNIRNIPAPYPSISMLSALTGNQEAPVYPNNKYNAIEERPNFDRLNTNTEKYSDLFRNDHSLIETKDAVVSKPYEPDFRQQFTPLQYYPPPLHYNDVSHQPRPENSSNLNSIDPNNHSINFARRDMVHTQYTNTYDNTNLTHTADHSKPFNNYYYDSYDRSYDTQYYHNATHSYTNNYSQHTYNKTTEDLHYLRYPNLPHNSNPTQDQCNNYPSNSFPYCPPQKNNWQHE